MDPFSVGDPSHVVTRGHILCKRHRSCARLTYSRIIVLHVHQKRALAAKLKMSVFPPCADVNCDVLSAVDQQGEHVHDHI